MKTLNYMLFAVLAASSSAYANTAAKIENSYKETKANAKAVITDSMITARVKELFLLESSLSAEDIHVTTKNKVVTLTGKVDTEYERNLAITLANGVDGVKAVHYNKLKAVMT